MARYFDSRARDWQQLYLPQNAGLSDFHVRREAVLEALDRCCPATPLRRVADIGCGSGPNLARLRQHPGRGIGLDIAPGMLSLAGVEVRDRSDWPLIRATADSLPLASGCFDAVLAVGLVAHFDHPGATLRELARILKPGGVGIATFPNVHAWSRLAGLPRSLPMYFSIARRSRWRDILRRARILRADGARPVAGEAYSRRRIEELLEASGVEIESITSSGFTRWPVLGFEVLPRKLRARLGSILQRRRHRFPWRHLGSHWIVVFKRH